MNDSDAVWEALTPVPGSLADPAVPAAPATERGQIAAEIERRVDRTYRPNDRSAEAVRELAHAVRRNDLKDSTARASHATTTTPATGSSASTN